MEVSHPLVPPFAHQSAPPLSEMWKGGELSLHFKFTRRRALIGAPKLIFTLHHLRQPCLRSSSVQL